MSRILLAGVGSARDVTSYSGTPYFMLESARLAEADWGDAGLDVTASVWRRRRFAWNLRSVLSGRGRGGFQFTDDFLERLWDPVRPMLNGAHLLNWTQLYPTTVARDRRMQRSFYIDQTLTQLFDGYGIRARISTDVAADALRREAAGYADARAVITTSEWGRQAVLATPGVDPARVHVVVPGANLPSVEYEAWAKDHRPRPSNAHAPLRLVFVGAHPLRKGLDRLLRSVITAREHGALVSVSVVGTDPKELPAPLRQIPGVEWHGRIDKVKDLKRFLAVVASADVGCLLSRSEASAISLREFQALGLAVLGPDAGGCAELVPARAGSLVAPSDSDEVVAARLIELANDRERVAAMRAESWARRHEVLWPTAVAKIRSIIG